MTQQIKTPEILFQDEDLIILNKPANLLSVPGRGPEKQDCLASRVQIEFPTALTVHRLDFDTSGIIVMALNKPAQSMMGRIFQERKITKIYHAIIDGHPELDSGSIDLPMRCDFDNRPLQIIDHDQGKQALTHWSQIERYDNDTSRIELRPHTGRSHQLRLHMQSLGHPIIGDNLYGSNKTDSINSRLMLHATRLTFEHPKLNQIVTINCPADF